MKRFLLILMTFIAYSSFSQDDYIEENDSSYEYVEHGTNTVEDRSFDKELKSKYNGAEFKYKEKKAKKKDVKPINKETEQRSLNFFKGLTTFLSTVFPYLLALIVVLIIVKSVLAGNTDFWRFKKQKIKKSAIVKEESEENIAETDYESLLKLAITNNDFRKATRYYYLLLLKRMHEKELINYDKDKTNSEYVFDLKKIELRKHFSYLLYIYDYVWYGEFVVNETNFSTIEKEYESFLKKI
ncbi:hypothetical protein ACOSP6_11795 [Tenacibaculum sp. MEBiC06402]|uniref:hypothetical protein n=1 Tax=unclassified Tenacibaculum TaxID=2635139 RepID=UPI003B993868